MAENLVELFDRIRANPIASLALALLTVWGYSNIFIFGFLLEMPPATRPFLDSYFFANISLQFFSILAVSIAIGRVLALFLLYSLKSIDPNIAKTISWFWPLASVLQVPGKKHTKSMRQARLVSRIGAKWVRRQNFFLTNMFAISTFSILFLGWESVWFIPVTVLSLPTLWVVISRAELRRDFATAKNIKGIARNRILSSLLTLFLVHLAFVSYLAGTATFKSRISSEVSVGLETGLHNLSLIAVTGSGIVVGQYINGSDDKSGEASLRFLPYSSFSSVGQTH